MWDDDDFEIHDGPPEKGYHVFVFVLAVVLAALFYFQNF